MVDITFGYGSKSKHCAIVDIGAGGVCFSIVENNAASCTVLATGRSILTPEVRTDAQSIGLLAQQIKEAGDLALKAYAAHHQTAPIETVYAVVHVPWARTQTVTARKKFESDTIVRATDISELAKEAFATAKEIDTTKLLEASVTRIEVNGYRTRHPEGMHARTLDVLSLVSDCNPEVKTIASSALQTLFPVAKTVWRSGARAIAAFADNTALMDKDVLIVDMSADATHIVSLRNGSLEQSVVPEGIATIIGRIAGGKMPDEVLGHVRMLDREACSNEACETIEKSMGTAEPELARIFGEAIGKMAATRHVPNDLILITHQDLQTWLGRFFTRIDFTQFTVTTLPFTVHTPVSLGIGTWILGEHEEPALAVDTALVNIEDNS